MIVGLHSSMAGRSSCRCVAALTAHSPAPGKRACCATLLFSDGGVVWLLSGALQLHVAACQTGFGS